MELIMAVTGASGTVYSLSLLKELKRQNIETHLIITDSAQKVGSHEIGDIKQLTSLATHIYNPDDMAEWLSCLPL